MRDILDGYLLGLVPSNVLDAIENSIDARLKENVFYIQVYTDGSGIVQPPINYKKEFKTIKVVALPEKQ